MSMTHDTVRADDDTPEVLVTEFATIVCVEPMTGRILSGRTVLIGNVLTLLPLILLFAAIARTISAAERWVKPLLAMNIVLDAQTTVGLVLFAAALASAGFALYWLLRNVTRIASKYVRWRADHEFHARPDRIVAPNDSDAMFVEIVPRKNWGKLMLETASDVGYLLVDERRREVVFEGDCERCRIPGGAIQSCYVEAVAFGDITTYFTVVRAALDREQIWEAPFVFRGDFGMLGAATRQERAIQLEARIRQISDLDQREAVVRNS